VNLCTSTEDLQKAFNQEVEQLRKLASKGLGGAGGNPPANHDTEAIHNFAGSSKAIKLIKQELVKAGAVSALEQIFTTSMNLLDEEKEAHDKLFRKADSAMEPFAPHMGGVSEKMAENMIESLLLLADDPENRGAIVQQRGLRLLLNLFGLHPISLTNLAGAPAAPSDKPTIEGMLSPEQRRLQDCALAIVRIAITTNPHLYPQGMAYSMILPMGYLLHTTGNELFQFETCISVANIATLEEDVRDRMFEAGVWSELMNVIASENFRVQKAALQALTNLVVCSKSIDRLASPSGDTDIKIFLLFAKTDDVEAQSAALGALAMMASDKTVAAKLPNLDVLPTVLVHCNSPDGDVRVRANAIMELLKRHGVLPAAGSAAIPPTTDKSESATTTAS